MQNLVGSLKYYGIKEGLRLYFKLKNFKIDSITTNKLLHEVHLRPNSTDNCVFKQIFLKQDFNIDVINNIEPKVILDLGANIGLSSLYFANEFKNATIIGVEMDEENGNMFKKNLRHFPNVKFMLAAIRGDNAKVKIADEGKGETGYIAKEDHDGMPASTISDIMEQYDLSQIDILKMDIEGSEKSVFDCNFDSWLPKVKILLVELHEQKAAGCEKVLENALSKYNFRREKSGEYEVLINEDL